MHAASARAQGNRHHVIIHMRYAHMPDIYRKRLQVGRASLELLCFLPPGKCPTCNDARAPLFIAIPPCSAIMVFQPLGRDRRGKDRVPGE